jgi:uncharacterized RDD family membrane protein YckC
MSSYSIKPTRFYLILFFFLLGELVFLIEIMNVGNGDMAGALFKSLLIVVLFYFFYRGKNWARWILMVVLGLLTLACVFAAFENEPFGFVVIIVSYLIAIAGIYKVENKKAILDNQSVESNDPETQPLKPGTFVLKGTEYKYPSLVKRYKALLVDGLLLLTVMIITMVVLGNHENRPYIMISMWILFSFVYEPVLTAYSTTIGQRVMKIRVRDYNNPSQPIKLGNAYIRLLVKNLFGWISFVTIHFNPEHRAMHDLACSSVVIDFREETGACLAN